LFKETHIPDPLLLPIGFVLDLHVDGKDGPCHIGYYFTNTVLFVSKYRVNLIYLRDSVEENVNI
jgi:hypothetical protein